MKSQMVSSTLILLHSFMCQNLYIYSAYQLATVRKSVRAV